MSHFTKSIARNRPASTRVRHLLIIQKSLGILSSKIVGTGTTAVQLLLCFLLDSETSENHHASHCTLTSCIHLAYFSRVVGRQLVVGAP